MSDELEETEFKSRLDSYLKPHLPSGLTLVFCRWNEDDMHNRFILTNIGLLEFGIGLDEYDGGSTPREEQVMRLSDTDHSKFWAKYSTGAVFHSIAARSVP